MSAQLQYEVEQFLYRNAAFCDAQDWKSYLDDFTEDSEFHLPQWDSEHEYTRDPKQGMSLIYYANRTGLEDRVFRIQTGKAASTNPMPRTLHLINNVRITPLDGGDLEVAVNWHTLYYRLSVTGQLYGHATYRLRASGNSWKIARKHALLLNDTVNAVLDFYHL